jgi:hypothetical protein
MERREHPRFLPLRLMATARCLTGSATYLCTTRDVSLGGMLLETPNRPLPAAGDLLEINLLRHGDLPLECEVTRVGDDGAIAVRYLSLTAASRALVQSIVETAERALHAPAAAAPPVEADARRHNRPTGVIDEEVLRPLVRATRAAEARDGQAQPGAPARPQVTREPSSRSGSDIVKALQAATGEQRVVPATVDDKPGETSTPGKKTKADDY